MNCLRPSSRCCPSCTQCCGRRCVPGAAMPNVGRGPGRSPAVVIRHFQPEDTRRAERPDQITGQSSILLPDGGPSSIRLTEPSHDARISPFVHKPRPVGVALVEPSTGSSTDAIASSRPTTRPTIGATSLHRLQDAVECPASHSAHRRITGFLAESPGVHAGHECISRLL